MDRASQLAKFGQVPKWLAGVVEGLTPRQWRLLYDGIESEGRIPETFEETMPRDECGRVVSPVLEHDQLAAIRAWRDWSEIWGDPPWKTTAARR